jgi:hypothetical protein
MLRQIFPSVMVALVGNMVRLQAICRLPPLAFTPLGLPLLKKQA